MTASSRNIRLPEVLEIMGVGKTTLYAMIKTGEFPAARKVRSAAVWDEKTVLRKRAEIFPEAVEEEDRDLAEI